MKQDIIQTSFSGGEFGPSLFGRTDVAAYANACEIVENFLPRSYGPAISMPGTRYVATVSDSTLKTGNRPRLRTTGDPTIRRTRRGWVSADSNRGQIAD